VNNDSRYVQTAEARRYGAAAVVKCLSIPVELLPLNFERLVPNDLCPKSPHFTLFSKGSLILLFLLLLS
jgi:hypothetical protein